MKLWVTFEAALRGATLAYENGRDERLDARRNENASERRGQDVGAVCEDFGTDETQERRRGRCRRNSVRVPPQQANPTLVVSRCPPLLAIRRVEAGSVQRNLKDGQRCEQENKPNEGSCCHTGSRFLPPYWKPVNQPASRPLQDRSP